MGTPTNIFQANTKIRSAQVNANFQQPADFFDYTNTAISFTTAFTSASNITMNGVTAAETFGHKLSMAGTVGGGASDTYGYYLENSTTTTGDNYGAYYEVEDATNATYGVKTVVSGGTNNYAFYGDASSAGGNIAYGIYAKASGDGTNIAGFFFGHVIPEGAGTWRLGDAGNYWNDISYKTLTDRGCLGCFDDGVEMPDGKVVSDCNAIASIKKHPTKKTIYGKAMMDYKSFPKVSYKKAVDQKGKEIKRDKDDEPINASDGIEMTSMFSIMMGAIKELHKRLEKVEKK